jgi:V/A-type H+-transporting ATPase subunit I
MLRVAIVAPDTRLRRVLVEVADLGVFEPDPALSSKVGPASELASGSVPADTDLDPVLAVDPVAPAELLAAGRFDLLLGEATLEQHIAAGMHTDRCTVIPGWIPARYVDQARAVIEPHGGSVAALPGRRDLIPPTAHTDSAVGTAFRPLVTTYATIPYRDLDPTLFAALAYMLMFGMMFGDVAHGLAIVGVGLLALFGTLGPLQQLRGAAPFLIGAGLAAAGFGLLYGEAFGPTGLVPTLWIRPLHEPERLLIAGLVVGGVMLALTLIAATVNRWRERGPTVAIYDASGLAGLLLLFGLAGFAIGATSSIAALRYIGAALAVLGAVLTFIGLVAHSPSGPAGMAEAIVEMFDTLLRLGSNVVSFTRLAAFGLTHAVISEVVWDGTVSLWNRSALMSVVAAVALFTLGNVAAFALGALVGAIQALRLEYYELFSRLFVSQGRPFEPWHVPAQRLETS